MKRKVISDWFPDAAPMTHEAMLEIAAALEGSPAIVLGCNIIGGAVPTGVRLALAYEGDDVPACGKDILFWMRWHRTHGRGDARSPRMAFDTISELPEMVRLELDFGCVGDAELTGLEEVEPGELGAFRVRVVD